MVFVVCLVPTAHAFSAKASRVVMDHQYGSWSTQAPSSEKSIELYIRDYPHRSIAIVSLSHALILRYSAAATEGVSNGSSASLPRQRAAGGDGLVAKCMVEFSPISPSLLKDYRPLTTRPVYGTLGLIASNNEVFLSIITHASRAATVRPGETVERIAHVAFYCLSSADYDDVVPLEPIEGEPTDAVSMYAVDSSGHGQGLGRREVAMEHPCHDLRKLLSNGSFYYSTDFDVTNKVQNRYAPLAAEYAINTDLPSGRSTPTLSILITSTIPTSGIHS